MLTIGLGALALTGAVAAEPASAASDRVARAGDEAASAAARDAARAAASSAKALKRGRPAAAVMLAERAVELSPRDGRYRAALGRGYLRAGRFASARVAFAEALALSPDDGAAALNLALAQAALGEAGAARATLDAHAHRIQPADLGLALALAGLPEAGVRLLVDAARQPGAGARTRQNLGLALGLAGNWQMARAVAAVDLSPAALDSRMLTWAAMATPGDPIDRVARLLNVTPAVDPGRPAALALLVPSTPVRLAATPAAAAAAAAAAPASGIVFAPHREVVQAVPGAAGPAGERWTVQIGAYAGDALARAGWARAQRRFAAFADARPVLSGKSRLRELAVPARDRRDAVDTCRRYRAAGGDCFVRTFSGERLAAWLAEEAGAVTLAAR